MVSLSKLTPLSPACYGIGCSQRAQCARYHAIEDTVSHLVIDSCIEGEEWPRFSPMEVVEACGESKQEGRA